MPRMPTEDALGFNLPRSRDVPRQRRDIIGEAVQNAGRQVSQLGRVMGDVADRQVETGRSIALKKKAEDDALDLARARSDWTKRRLEEQDLYQIDKNPDYSKWEKGYTTNIEKHRTASASLIRDPRLREKFELETADDVTAGTLTIRNRAGEIDREGKVTQAVQGLNDSIDMASRPGVDAATSSKILAQARANIDNMQATGLITPGKAMEMRRDLAKRYAKTKVEQDIKDDPLAASTWLEGGASGAEGLIRRNEGYRARPYWDKDAYRVGFGSDTVTMEDGTVLKVKPGMEITRADAERDLKRRIGEFQSGIVKEIGSDAWALIPPAAQAALTSVAYNYGSLPASVVTAIKTRDMNQVADAVRALQTHNKGINAARRNREADIIAGGGDQVTGLSAPDYYSVLDTDERMQLQTTADAEWTAREKEMREATALDRYKLTTAIDNDITQIRETGKATDIDPQAVIDTLGEDDAAKWLEKRQLAADTFEAVSVQDTMTNDQIEEHLAALEPKAGTPDFARRQEVYDAAEKRAKTLQDLRLKDPAKAVEDSPLVMQAKQGVKAEDPASIQGVIKARLAAQEQVGIPKAIQKPITRKEAYAIIAPVQTIIDGVDAAIIAAQSKAKTPAERRTIAKAAKKQAEDEIRATIDTIEKTYGPYAQDVLAFAIAESVRDKEIGDIAAGIYRKISRGEKPTASDMSALESATEASTAEKAMDGQIPPAPSQPAPAARPAQAPAATSQPQQPVMPGPRTPQPQTNRRGVESPPGAQKPAGAYPPPSRRAVDFLIANPGTAAQFDAIYGPGAAREWMPRFPQE